MIDYSEQIKSPKWQRKRLEILTRDNFECTACGATDKPLHVHHKKYIAGRDYWDYPDELLVTLCEDCHRKLHGKEELEKTPNPPRPVLHKPKPRSAKMKKIFYKTLLSENVGLTYNERILYSFLVSKSVSNLDAIWSSGEHRLNTDILEDVLSENPYIPICKMEYGFLSQELNMAFQSAINGVRKLQLLKLIIDDTIFVDIKTIRGGYFELVYMPSLKTETLIFYSYLKDKASKYGGIIDTFKWKLANETGVSKVVIKKLFNRLYKLGLIKRLKDNKLQIL